MCDFRRLQFIFLPTSEESCFFGVLVWGKRQSNELQKSIFATCRTLLGNVVDPESMNMSTGKNIFSDITSKEVIIHVFWCYGLRFIPAITLLSLAHLVSRIKFNYLDAKSYYEIVLILLIKILLLRPNKYYFRFFLVNLN